MGSEWCEKHPGYTFIIGYIVLLVVSFVLGALLGDAAILLMYILYFALSAYILHLKNRSMWWLLLAGLLSPLWLSKNDTTITTPSTMPAEL